MLKTHDSPKEAWLVAMAAALLMAGVKQIWQLPEFWRKHMVYTWLDRWVTSGKNGAFTTPKVKNLKVQDKKGFNFS